MSSFLIGLPLNSTLLILSIRSEFNRARNTNPVNHMPILSGLMRRVRRAFGLEDLPPLDPRLTAMEHIFRAPPLTPELIAAIKLISPHFNFANTERSRWFWEADQNGSCWGEYEALTPLFSSMPRPSKVLEIG